MLRGGDLFGLATMRDEARTSVVAVSDCEVISVDGVVATEVTARRPELTSAINQLLSRRRRQLQRLQERAAGDSRVDGEPVVPATGTDGDA